MKTKEIIEDITLDEEEEIDLEDLTEEVAGEEPAEQDSFSAKQLQRMAESYPELSLEEEIELGKKMRAGDKAAKQKLINSNLRYAIVIAKLWKRRTYATPTSTSLDDMIQNAVVGLMLGVEKYDPQKKVRLISFARHDVNQSIRRGLDTETHMVKLPSWRAERIALLRHVGTMLERELGRWPTAKELYEYFEHRLSLETIQEHLALAGNREHVSIDADCDWSEKPGASKESPGECSMLDRMEDTSNLLEREKREDRESLREAWSIIKNDPEITERERVAAKALFSKNMHLAEAGVYMKECGFPGAGGAAMTKENVRLIERSLIAKIREKMQVETPREEREKQAQKRTRRRK